jgi:hypothetical protein
LLVEEAEVAIEQAVGVQADFYRVQYLYPQVLLLLQLAVAVTDLTLMVIKDLTALTHPHFLLLL